MTMQMRQVSVIHFIQEVNTEIPQEQNISPEKENQEKACV